MEESGAMSPELCKCDGAGTEAMEMMITSENSEFLNVCEEMQVEGEDEVGMTFSLANSQLLRNGNEGAADFVTRGEN